MDVVQTGASVCVCVRQRTDNHKIMLMSEVQSSKSTKTVEVGLKIHFLGVISCSSMQSAIFSCRDTRKQRKLVTESSQRMKKYKTKQDLNCHQRVGSVKLMTNLYFYSVSRHRT